MSQYIALSIAIIAPIIYLIYINGPPQRKQPSDPASSMADQVQKTAQGTASKVPAKGSDGKPLTEEQQQQQQKQTWSEYGKQVYNEKYEAWVPWIEDLYLRWFTRDNKLSYATKDALDKTKVTGIKQVDDLQDGVHGLATGQLGQDGLLAPVGNTFSKEGINRAERGGKGEDGQYVSGPAGAVVNPVAQGGAKVGGGVVNAGKGVGGAVGGLFGGGKK